MVVEISDRDCTRVRQFFAVLEQFTQSISRVKATGKGPVFAARATRSSCTTATRLCHSAIP